MKLVRTDFELPLEAKVTESTFFYLTVNSAIRYPLVNQQKEAIMSRVITVSTEVFATIWANREEGEETENSILSRLLNCTNKDGNQDMELTTEETSGVHDVRNNVRFHRGFVTFRTYKRRKYEAIAQDSVWLRKDTGKTYPTLNQLNNSIVAGAENVWNGNWKYYTEDGSIRSIGDLRR